IEKLNKLYEYPIVGEIRGKGLMIGIEFVEDQKTKEPFEVGRNVKGIFTKNCLEEGVVPYPGGGSVDGVRGDHVLFAPPITIKREETELLYEKIEKAMIKTCEEVVGEGGII